MDFEEKVKQLESERQAAQARTDTLARQIAFAKEWIVKLQARLKTLQKGTDAKAWRSAVRSPKELYERLTAELNTESQTLQALEEEYREVAERLAFLDGKLRVERSKEFDFGWRKRDAFESKGSKSRLGASELDALKVISEKGGETVFQVVSQRLKIEYDYARLLCTSLGKADYIDITAEGLCKITPKGEQALEERGIVSWR